MIDISRIEKEIFEGPGNAQEKLLRLYNKKLSYNNSVMYMAGIKLHINLLKNLRKNNTQELESEPEKIKYNSDKTKTIEQDIYLTKEEESAADPSVIMKKMNLDPLAWEVVSCEIVKGHFDVTMKMENEKIVNEKVVKSTEPLTVRNRKYSVKLRVKPISCQLTFPQVLEAFKELVPENIKDYTYDPVSKDVGLLLELPIMDFHFGKHSWGEESGDDYDLKTAEELWCESMIDLIAQAQKNGKVEKILFPVGQDFFHFDTPGITTTMGTQLNSDSRWQKVFRKGVEVLVWGVEKLRKIAPVEILWVPGNHDQMLSYAATVGLAQRYFNSKNVTVDLISTSRKYRSFGRNLIGYSHGEKEGKRLEGLMQLEAPDLWGKTIFREFHMGHLHTELTSTKNGIIFRRISAITGTDAWHAEHGFIGSTRQAQAFLWHRKLGLRAILNSNVIKEIEK